MNNRLERRRDGVVLHELLVLIAIPSLIAALLMPAVQQVREAARRSMCVNNLKQISLSCLNYESAHSTFPSGCHFGIDGGDEMFGWAPHLAPFMEMSFLDFEWHSVRGNLAPVGEALKKEQGEGFSVFRCPSDDQWSLFNYGRAFSFDDGTFVDLNSNYVGVNSSGALVGQRKTDAYLVGANGAFSSANRGRGLRIGGQGLRIGEFEDGLSNTLLFAERAGFRVKSRFWETKYQSNAACAFFSRGGRENSQIGLSDVLGSGHVRINYNGDTKNDLIYDSKLRQGFSSNHPSGINVAFADGSIQFLNEEIDADVDPRTHLVVTSDQINSAFERLICIDDGQKIGEF